MKTLRELAKFIQAAAAKHAALEADCGCARDITEATQAVAAEHGADDEDVAFVGSILFARWNDALKWAEARLKKPFGFMFRCPRCDSSHFTTKVENGVHVRFCRSGDGKCNFSFPESDDLLYFKEEDDA